MRPSNRLAASLLLLTSVTPLAFADHVPGHSRLEWGVGLAQLWLPDYRGSSHQQSRLLPFPYLKYRGERLQIDDGIEGRLFKTPDILLSISGNGSLPTSDDNPERVGMDDLDATVELGPSLEIRLRHDNSSSLWLEMPLRFAYTLGSSIAPIGRIFQPRIAWKRPASRKYNWKLRAVGGPMFADDEFHGYFYNVAAHEVTPQRSEYTADSGYSGFRFDFSYSRRIDKWWLGGFFRYDNLDGSEIESSPLVSENESFSAGISLGYIISER
jgi:outer membrane scaffolding protein for murein synthesis (MipA/OmpV family)